MTGGVTTMGAGALVRVTFEYASSDDAKQAAGAVTAASTDAALAPELRALARDAHPTIRDRFVDLQLDGKVMVDNATTAALQQWIEAKRAAPPAH
jgi:hypothetical protein